MNKKKKAEINAFYEMYKKEKGEKMFEKEAEDNKPPYAFCTLDTKCELWKDGFQKGAEYGYNKANEWHKVADGDIPENERWVCNQDGCYCYYDIDTEQWLDVEGTRTKTIEWCDMPTKESE